MKAPFSSYLSEIAPALKTVIGLLGKEYDYVSILSTDSRGFAVSISRNAKTVRGRTMTTERGSVVRVAKDGLYSEYAFNEFDPEKAEELARTIKESLDRQLLVLKAAGTRVYETGLLPDEPCELLCEMETGSLPEETDFDALIALLTGVSDKAIETGAHVIECSVVAQSTHICKLFLTKNRDMRQSYVYSEGVVAPVGARDGRTEMGRSSLSGRVGPELFLELPGKVEEAVRIAEELLVSERMVPGEYEVITSPEVTISFLAAAMPIPFRRLT